MTPQMDNFNQGNRGGIWGKLKMRFLKMPKLIIFASVFSAVRFFKMMTAFIAA